MAALLVPWVVLSFATAVLSLSWTWIVAVPVAVPVPVVVRVMVRVMVMVSTIAHCPAVNPDWWRIRPPARSVAAVLVAFAVVALTGVLALERDRPPVPRAAPIDAAIGPPVLVVKGFNSSWDGIRRQWVRGDFRIQRFS